MTASQGRTTSIDWQKARDRLAKAKEGLEEGHRLSPQRARVVLDERARAIARIPTEAPAAGALLEVVTFTLGNEHYAIETVHVREVLRLRDCTPLPGTPAFLIGVTNLRGQILAVLDLRGFFGLANQEASDLSRIIVLGQERIEFGILADAVQEVAVLRIDEVRETPGSVAGIAREYLRGMTSSSLILLEGAVLLKDPRLFIDLSETSGPGSSGVTSAK